MKLTIASILSLALAATPAAAKLCGDDVDGQDVPCACGDVVVSDLVLGDDPVANAPCDGHGLMIRATGAGLDIDLAGAHLRGSGGGHGIVVVHGGDGGTRITSQERRAVIEGFDHGVVATGGDLSLLENVDVRRVDLDGVRVRGSGVVRNCSVSRAGRDGFALGGRGFRAVDNQSRNNARHGFMLMGHDGQLSGNQVSNCGGACFQVTGGGHSIEECTAEGCGKNGLELVTGNAVIRACVARQNGASGIEGHGSGWRLADNLATGNGEHGIKARGPGMVDEGGNRGSDNGAHASSSVEQCLIGDVPCAAPAASAALAGEPVQ